MANDDEEDNIASYKDIPSADTDKIQLSLQCLDKTFLYWKQG